MLALVRAADGRSVDVAYSGGRLVDAGYDLRTSWEISTFTDAPARSGDPVPRGHMDRGWWAQEFLDELGVPGPNGSRLWTLKGAQAVPETLKRGAFYQEECVQWMVDAGMVATVTVDASFVGKQMCVSTVLTRPDGKEQTFVAWVEVGVG